MKNNKNSEIKVAIITGIFGITGALITGIVSGYFSYKTGADNMEQKIENKISQVINVDNGDVEKAFTRGGEPVEAFKVDGTTVSWTTGEGSANAMEYMNAAIPAEYLWHFVPSSGPEILLVPERASLSF